MDFYQRELQDGVRFSWNYWPLNKATEQRIVIPVASIYTPLKEIENMPLVEYAPIQCIGCQCVLNPSCHVDFRFKTWSCPLCNAKNNFPPHYAQNINEQTLPAELMPEFTTIEYVYPRAPQDQRQQQPSSHHNNRPIFLLIVDTAVPAEELAELKDSLQQSINFIPPDAYIGLITYGKMTYLHELSFADCPRSFCFRGDKELTPRQIHEQLGLTLVQDPLNKGENSGIKRFLVPVSECEFAINTILDDLQPDPWPVKKMERSLRCVGTALNVGISLLEAASPGQNFRGSRIVNLVGGPVTYGPGMIVSHDLNERIRSHLDISKEKDNTKYMKKAIAYYSSLSQRCQKAGIVMDLFVASLDQIGVLEMKTCFENTGGYYVMTDSFGNPVFKESFKKFFEVDQETGELKMGFLAQIKHLCSGQIKIQGSIGQVSPIKVGNKAACVSDSEVGTGGTNVWYIGGIDKNKSFVFYYDIVNNNTTSQTTHQKVYLQFQTTYQHVSGQKRLRVTTVQRLMSPQSDLRELAYGFDQETSAVIMAKLAVFKTMQGEEQMDVIKWLDRTLIKLVGRFAEYKADDANTFKLSREFSLFPQFLFYLRRSQFLNTFNASPDESEYYRISLLRENVANCLVMIQPALMQYTMEQLEPVPVLLDIDSLKNQVVLLLDTFFYVCIWKGEDVAAWEKAGYQNDPEYENFRIMLQTPIEDAKYIMAERFPLPRFFISNPGDTNERKIKVRVNPSSLTAKNSTVESGNFFTEDVNLSVFMQSLIKMAVSTSNT